MVLVVQRSGDRVPGNTRYGSSGPETGGLRRLRLRVRVVGGSAETVEPRDRSAERVLPAEFDAVDAAIAGIHGLGDIGRVAAEVVVLEGGNVFDFDEIIHLLVERRDARQAARGE